MTIFQVEGIRPRLIDVQTLVDNVTETMLDEGEEQRKMFQETVKHWKDKPEFEIEIEVDGADVTLHVRPTGKEKLVQIWGWIDGGTKPYTITPKLAPALRFQVPYYAGSKPGTLKTGPGRTGNQWVSTKVVRHHGIKARGWTRLVQKKRENYFVTKMRRAARNIKMVSPRTARRLRQAVRPQRR